MVGSALSFATIINAAALLPSESTFDLDLLLGGGVVVGALTGISPSTFCATTSNSFVLFEPKNGRRFDLKPQTACLECTMTSSLQAKKSNDRRCPPQTKVGAREARALGDKTRTKKRLLRWSSKLVFVVWRGNAQQLNVPLGAAARPERTTASFATR